jgi:hypothetical protein
MLPVWNMSESDALSHRAQVVVVCRPKRCISESRLETVQKLSIKVPIALLWQRVESCHGLEQNGLMM